MSTPTPTEAPRLALSVRVLSLLPLAALHALARALAWLATVAFPYRRAVVDANLEIAFPDLDAKGRALLARDYYRGFADVLVEIVKIPRLSREQLRARVSVEGLAEVRMALDGGRPVLLLAAHQCNWEWMLQVVALELGFPLDVAYKPLKSQRADQAMLALRSGCGCRMVPADALLPEIIKRRHEPRAIAMIADQEPKKAERRVWMRFLNRDSAFFMGAEEIARTTGYASYFVGMRRLQRGHYAVAIEPMTAAREQLPRGEFMARYAQRVEAQIHAAPADWPWSHKRWQLQQPLYAD